MNNYDEKAVRRRNTIEFLKMDMERAVYDHRKNDCRDDAAAIIIPAVQMKKCQTIGIWRGGC